MGIEKLDKDLIAMAIPKITKEQRLELTGLNEEQMAVLTAEVTSAFSTTLYSVQSNVLRDCSPQFRAGTDVQQVVVYIATRIKDIGRGG